MAEVEQTAGEKAYLESGGTEVTALLAENVPPEPKVETPVVPVETAKPADTAPAVAEAAPAEPAIEPGEEELPTPDGKGKRRVVDSRALKKTRDELKAREAELATERDLRARVDERLKMLSEAVSAAPAETPTEPAKPAGPPNVEEDVFGAIRYALDKINGIETQFGEQRQQSAEERAVAQSINAALSDKAAFVAQQPDFMDAYNHLFSLRKEQLELQGYTPQETARWLYVEELGLIQRAQKAGKSPAQQIYRLSKTMGYAPKAPAQNGHVAPQPAAVVPAVPAAPVAAAPVAPVAPAAPSVTAEVDRIRAGQAASRSLSNAGGDAGEELSLEWLANAPIAEFDRFMATAGNREKVERAMGKLA